MPAENSGGDVAVRLVELKLDGISPLSSTTARLRRHPTPLHTTMDKRRKEDKLQNLTALEEDLLIEIGLTSHAAPA
jgi:hypothetical protein